MNKNDRLFSWFAWTWLSISTIYYNKMSTGFFSPETSILISSIFVMSFLTGDIFVRTLLANRERFNNVSTVFIVGIFISIVVLYFSALLLPFGLTIDWAITVTTTALIWCVTRRTTQTNFPRRSSATELLFIVLTTLSVMLWCWDILRPMELKNGVVSIRAWHDVYYHMAQIGSIAMSNGLESMSDLQMAGTLAQPYHIASYVFPALLVDFAKISALEAYAGFMVPFGIMLTALAAYSLASSIFGKWPGFAAGVSVLLLPDTFQQGFGNQFLGGYYWLQQIAPSGNYGVASAAVAFMLIFEGCRTNSHGITLSGYVFALLTVILKAQIFVAISFLAFVYPVLFSSHHNLKTRGLLTISFTVIYILTLELSQLSQSVPAIQFNGTSLMAYSSAMLNTQPEGLIKTLLNPAYAIAGDNWLLRAVAFDIFLLIATFGTLPVIYTALLLKIKNFKSDGIWLFPLLVTLMHLLMATTLAFDDRHFGAPEELLHRPYVWAYFILVIWCSAGAYMKFFGDSAPQSTAGKFVVIILALGLLSTPLINQKGIQKYEHWNIGFQELPACQVKSAEFVKAQSDLHAIVQDSLNDPRFMLSGLSERQAFAIDSGGIRSPKDIKQRLKSLENMKSFEDASTIEEFMKQNGINWYVTSPKGPVAWQAAMNGKLAFRCGDYRVYQF